jgi:hypothetical protein
LHPEKDGKQVSQAPTHPVHLSVLEELGIGPRQLKSTDAEVATTTSCYAVARTPRYGDTGPYQDAVYVRLTPSAAETKDGKTTLKTMDDLSQARDWTEKWLRETETVEIIRKLSDLLTKKNYSEEVHRETISRHVNLSPQRLDWAGLLNDEDEEDASDGSGDGNLSTSSFDLDSPGS